MDNKRVCDNCAQYTKLNLCNKKAKVCDRFIDNRASCRFCLHLQSCQLLHKKTGLQHVCVNFEKQLDRSKVPPREAFEDYTPPPEPQPPIEKTEVVSKPKKKLKLKADNPVDESLQDADIRALQNKFQSSELPESWSPEYLVEKIISSNYDQRAFETIDEHEIPKATNPVEFIIDPNFLNINLFPRQLQISLNYFSAYCPKCSDRQFIQDIEVNTPVGDILDRTVLYRDGICPKCGENRYQHIHEGLHHNYNTLVGLAGQRCVTGDTLILTENGLEYMEDIASKHPYTIGFTPYKGPEVYIDGELVHPESFYRSEPEEVFTVLFSNGIEITGTKEHPIYTIDGYVKIKDLQPGIGIPVVLGQNTWGKCISETDNILNAPDSMVRSYLQDYFEKHADIVDDAIVCDCKNRKKAIQVHCMLANWGIAAYIENNTVFITGQYAMYFESYIGFASKAKCKALSLALLQHRKIDHWYNEIPSSLYQRFSPVLSKILPYCTNVTDTNINRESLYYLNWIIDENKDSIPSELVSQWKEVYSIVDVSTYYNTADSIKDREIYSTIAGSSYYTSVVSITPAGVEPTYDFHIPGYNRFYGNGIINHNSGKSIFHGILAATILHQYLSLPNPVTFMKQLNSVTFRMTFVGLRFQDAYENLWQDFFANITNSPWYSMYNQFLVDEGIRIGTPLIKINDTFAVYIGKRISISPAGPDKRKLRGRCVTGQTLISTNRGSYRADSRSLTSKEAFAGGKYHKIVATEKQKEQKKVVQCIFGNGIVLECSTDHRIPCFDLDISLVEASNLLNRYVMCQLNAGFGFPSAELLKTSMQDALDYIRKHLENDFTINAYNRNIQQLVLRFCSCKIVNDKIKLSRYDANLLQQFLKTGKEISFGKEDCWDYLIPGTDVYTKSDLNFKFNITVPEHLEKFIDRGIIFVQCTEIRDVGYKDVYDIEVDSDDHLYAANSILVHNTRILGSMDEVGHFTGKEGSMTLDADEVSIALENSLKTVRNESEKLISLYPDIPNAHAIYISSPRTKLDKIMRLYKQSTSIDSMYGFRHATWDFNPNFTKESFKDEYAKDPVAAEANFGANPPFGDDPYIRSPAAIVSVLSNKKNVFSIIYYQTMRDSLGGLLRYPIIKIMPHDIPCVLSIDAGVKFNSFALTLVHYLTSKDTGAMVPACSGIIEIQPEEGIPLSFPQIYERVIKRILDEFNVRIVAFDRWQSINLTQQIYEDYEIDAIRYSVTNDDFNNLKADILSGNFILPKCEQEIEKIIKLDTDLALLTKNKPVSHLIIQLLTSKDNGKIIVKGDETSDDILRALCLGHSILNNEMYSEMFETEETEDSISTTNFIGLCHSLGSTNPGTKSIAGIGCSLSI